MDLAQIKSTVCDAKRDFNYKQLQIKTILKNIAYTLNPKPSWHFSDNKDSPQVKASKLLELALFWQNLDSELQEKIKDQHTVISAITDEIKATYETQKILSKGHVFTIIESYKNLFNKISLDISNLKHNANNPTLGEVLADISYMISLNNKLNEEYQSLLAKVDKKLDFLTTKLDNLNSSLKHRQTLENYVKKQVEIDNYIIGFNANLKNNSLIDRRRIIVCRSAQSNNKLEPMEQKRNLLIILMDDIISLYNMQEKIYNIFQEPLAISILQHELENFLKELSSKFSSYYTSLKTYEKFSEAYKIVNSKLNKYENFIQEANKELTSGGFIAFLSQVIETSRLSLLKRSTLVRVILELYKNDNYYVSNIKTKINESRRKLASEHDISGIEVISLPYEASNIINYEAVVIFGRDKNSSIL